MCIFFFKDIFTPVQATKVQKGSHFTIMVSKIYKECKNYTWYFKSSCIDSKAIHIVDIEKYKNIETRKPFLAIQNFELSDMGMYQCYIQTEKDNHCEEWTLVCKSN